MRVLFFFFFLFFAEIPQVATGKKTDATMWLGIPVFIYFASADIEKLFRM